MGLFFHPSAAEPRPPDDNEGQWRHQAHGAPDIDLGYHARMRLQTWDFMNAQHQGAALPANTSVEVAAKWPLTLIAEDGLRRIAAECAHD